MFLTQCQKSKTPNTLKKNLSSTYAERFRIDSLEIGYKLTLFGKFQNDKQTHIYYIIPKEKTVPDSLKNSKIIRTPVERTILTNTTQIAMTEELMSLDKVIGFPGTDYISSEKAQQLIAQGKIKELGHDQAMNLEQILLLKPDLIFGFGVESISGQYEHLEKLGIPVLMDSGWLEKTPLGRAAWLKVFGLFYSQQELADSIFTTTKKNYLKLKETTERIKHKPSVISGSIFQDVWYAPAGESFIAQMIDDAGGDYLWKNTDGNGSLSLHIEDVLIKGKTAAYWIAPGDITSYKALNNAHKLYSEFQSVTSQKVYTYAHKRGIKGGITYFETSPLHPDWILEDFIHIFHPELTDSTYVPHYFFALDK